MNASLFEAMMVVSFGISWPMSIIRSYKGRTAKGKSPLFLFFIFFGYICGIAAKLIANSINYVLIFYILNLIMVAVDIILYFRNRAIDRKNSPPAGHDAHTAAK
ncbi:MAG: hypothetical protein GX303_03450 [Clostridiales bacterium]|nr:hypothetical protein [Clostridiales bacterium]